MTETAPVSSSTGTSTSTAAGSPARSSEDVEAAVAAYLARPPMHILGDPEAPVCVVEYGDYECPYCAAAAPVLHKLVEESEGQVRVVFRNFPLFEVHPHALTAALAAESAGATGGEEVFWHLHHKLFAQQARLTDVDLKLYAKAVGADPVWAVGDNAQRFAPIVQADYRSGVEVGVSGTPTLFVDGETYEGRIDLESLRRATGIALENTSRPRRRWLRR
jgi:protein-disulfide isomerase